VVQNEILSKIQSDKLKVYVVWTPVLNSDNRDSAIASTKNIYDPRVTHFWDADQSLGKLYGKTLELPNDGDLAWDIYFSFDKDVDWDKQPPPPTAWMHQLGMDERHLDGDKLRESIRTLLGISEKE